MQGLDTIVLLRFLLRDEPRQAKAARAAIAKAASAGEPLCLSLLTVLEAEWVLRTRAGLSKAYLLAVFKQLLEARDLTIAGEAVLEHALYLYENGAADFADCLLVADYQAQGCSSMLTFDAKASKVPGGQPLSA